MLPELPAEYSARMQQMLQEEFDKYIAAIAEPTPVSIRINPKKLKMALPYEPVLWCAEGYYLPQRPVFTFDPAFQAGAYYVQEASSMFIGWAIQQIASADTPLKVLDLCAAPGGKSTQIVSSISPESLLVANEVIISRVSVLKENLEKWGYPNTVITHNDPQDFEALEGFFDIVVCDAPCSGEGLFRKEPEAMKEWSESNVQLCSQRQQRILVSAVKTLKQDGFLIYSTCTHAPEENEYNVEWLCKEFGLEEIKLNLPKESGITESEYGYRFYPHKTRTEGFYCAVLRKKDGETGKDLKPKKQPFTAYRKAAEQLTPYFLPEASLGFYEKNEGWRAFPNEMFDNLNVLAEKLRVVMAGTETGQLLKNELIPSQGLAHSVFYNPNSFTSLELDIIEAVKYLRKEAVSDNTEIKGWKLATYKGLGLGFLKNLGNRTNNYFSKERRILKSPVAGEITTIIK